MSWASLNQTVCALRFFYAFTRQLQELQGVEWTAYAKPPFGGPTQVLANGVSDDRRGTNAVVASARARRRIAVLSGAGGD